ncbi:MAG: hypothetical protein H0T79_20315 [Deltaproteobacteria bacterium]|nr:hypothetical protein [Deltaproteobacteria bacterium]
MPRPTPWFLVGTLSTIICSSLAGCDSEPGIRSTPPDDPAVNDPAFTVRALENWYLVGDGLTADESMMTIVVDAPAGTKFVDAWIGSLAPVRLDETETPGTFGVQLSIADLPAKSHAVLLAADGAATAFAKVPFERSYPYYVMVSTDWDFADPGKLAIAYQDSLHELHPGMRLTHFVGPYTFTDPVITPARRSELVTWLLAQETEFSDEIGLHIHPYCNFVTTAGLTCITDQSTVYANDDSGYTVKLGAYGRTDFGTLLDRAHELFAQAGLPRPRTFRAGGWTATLETVQALNDKGYVADTSALNWATIEEWDGEGNGELYRWNMANWAPINATSQPYRPRETNVLEPGAPGLAIVEVPDNGTMIDYVSVAEMTAIFDANFTGTALAKPTTLMMGFHPAPGFSEPEFLRVDGFLKYADMHLATRDLGPVVYTTLADVSTVFATP